MKRYHQFTLRDRYRLHSLLKTGKKVDEIAVRLDKNRSSIYREIKRNKYCNNYLPDTAQKKYVKRRSRNGESKIRNDIALYSYIKERLQAGWSPEQISGRMKIEGKRYYVCHETIYRYLYIDKHGSGLYKYLAKAKPRRGKRLGRKVGSGKYKGIKLIDKRPITVEDKTNFGHWEGDTIAFAGNKYFNITTLVERKSRFVILVNNSSRQSEGVIGGIEKHFSGIRKLAVKTVTFDQGSEFARYNKLEKSKKCEVYFCNPHSPWQRGSNENTNGRLRRYLPRNFDVSKLNQNYVALIAKKLNNTPRKVLNYSTPAELFKAHSSYSLSHFKLE